MDNFSTAFARRAGLLALAVLPLASLAQNTDSLMVVHGAADGHKVSRLTVFKGGGLLLGGKFDEDISGTYVPAEGSGTRLMWYPEKAAFRFGYVNGTQWDAANIGLYSTAGGYNARASGDYGTAFGKDVVAAQISSTAIGEYCTATGAASVALGYYAHTNARQGTFVFADRSVIDDGNFVTDESFRAETNHSATWRVSNGFRIYTSANRSSGIIFQSGAPITGTNSTPSWYQSNAVISTSTGAYLSASGVWTNVSDRHKKHRFAAVSGEDVLTRLRRVPMTRWSYKVDKNNVRHLGPMAQDFHQAFGLGPDSVSIGTIDADGVALAGVQALDARTQAQATQISALKAENQELRSRLDALERRALAATVAAAPQSPATASLPLAVAGLLAGGGIGAALLRRRR
ncbi:tail fiber domain-containing protein [Hymenobacter cellulosivorans]|uniref:Tail fiber domain-containing protein n=1 Tax=Hymenobacter cellulosivorans TaxID=2932249 RepID=A0ABY4F7Q3_9BACT|nr:tail fiber domain-containing protein [Hymenobacter cellulosivorans]UOQ52231.1 tail fiber domain-containing protein [Hymenobacter cellulosivorans]